MFGDGCVLDLPLIAEIRLVQHQDERQGTELLGNALLQLDRLRKRSRAAAIHNQDVSGSAAQMRDLELGRVVLAREVPQHQRDGLGSNRDVLAIDLDADRGEIALVENAVDEAADQAGFADAELLPPCRFSFSTLRVVSTRG